MEIFFEPPNHTASLLIEHQAEEFNSNMQLVANKPPEYNGLTLDDLELTAQCDKLDKLDAYAVAKQKFNESASKYAHSDTAKQIHSKLTSKN